MDVAVVVVWQIEKEEAGLGGDGDADFISELESPAAFPVFLGNEDLDEGAKAALLSSVEHAVVGHVAANDVFPRRRER